MSDDLRELYQEMILDHGQRPRNRRAAAAPSHCAHGDNPLCGDTIDVYLTVDEGGIIRDAAFQGRGCAISVASASLMTEVLRGKTHAQALSLLGGFQRMCTGHNAEEAKTERDFADEMERLRVFSGVREFPMRVKCATLPWHTMAAAVTGAGQASTES